MSSQIKLLETAIRQHRWLYFNSLPEITDDEFDALINLLTELDPDNEVLDETGAPPKKSKVNFLMCWVALLIRV